MSNRREDSPRLRSWHALLALVAALALSPAAHAQDSAEQAKAEQEGAAKQRKAPAGYPSVLVPIPGGEVRLGLTSKEIQDLAKLRSKRGQREEARVASLMGRSLGEQEVEVADFFIGRTEVTNKEYEAFIRAVWPRVAFPFHWWKKENLNKHRREFFEDEANKGKSFIPEDYWRFRYDKLEWAIPEGDDNKPVTWVTYNDALLYCAWAGLRLPTEAEWQRAYEGDSKRHYVLGDAWDDGWLEKLNLGSLRDRQLKDVGTVPANVSPFGIHDMMGNVWEWTMSSFASFDKFENEKRKLERWTEKERRRNEDLAKWRAPLFDGSKYVLRGGSYLNIANAPLAFHGATRLPIDAGRWAEGFGFRVAKSLKPAFDASLLWSRTRLETSSLSDTAVDMPDSKGLRALADGKLKPSDFGQVGIERWDLENGVIKGHGMISFVAIKELPEYKRPREWQEFSAESGKDGYYGRPLAVLYSTERFQIKQGLRYGDVTLDPGIYSFEYRGKGLTFQLQKAMLEGSRVLKINKGKRPTEEEIAKLEEKQKKANEKKKGKGEEIHYSSAWMKIVDKYGVPDDVTRKYPKTTVKEITLNPGNVTIPADKHLILVRHHKKGYVAFIPWNKPIKKARANSKDAQLDLEIDRQSGELAFVGGPMVPQARGRLVFKLPIYVDPATLAKGWTAPQAPDRVVAKGLGKSSKGRASASPRRSGR
jgi:formylglycine-generating enzyme required for sulfatase activity